jgi:hypothetical protein
MEAFHLDIVSTSTDLVFENLPGISVTEVFVQNGENTQLRPKLVRVWTHDIVSFTNDLGELGIGTLREKFRDRATLSFFQSKIGFAELLQREASPDVRVLPVNHESQRHMLGDLRSALEEPLGRSSAGNNYVARLDVVVISQTSRSFLLLDDLLRLTSETTLADNSFVELYFMCSGDAMALDTCAILSDWSARLQSDGRTDKFTWHCLLPSQHTILNVMDCILESPTKALFFQSCSATRENLALKFTKQADVAWFRVLRDQRVKHLQPPASGSMLISESFPPFVPFRLLRVSLRDRALPLDGFDLTFNDFDGAVHSVALTSAAAVAHGCLNDSDFSGPIASSVVEYASSCLLPNRFEYAQLLGPGVSLKKQLGMIGDRVTASVRESLESALASITREKESLFPVLKREIVSQALEACAPVVPKAHADVLHSLTQLQMYVKEDFDAACFLSPVSIGTLYPFLRVFDPVSIAPKLINPAFNAGRHVSVCADYA